MHRTLLMLLYGTGMRRTEASRLKVSDIDSQRMVIHIHSGKGLRDRDVPLTPKLLEALREYWRWKKPRIYLFPKMSDPSIEQPISDKAVWNACRAAAARAGIRKKRGMAGGLALPWVAAPQFRSAATHPRTAGLDPLPAQASGTPNCRAQPIAEAAGDGQHHVGKRGLGCFRSLRPLDAARSSGRQSHPTRNGRVSQRASA